MGEIVWMSDLHFAAEGLIMGLDPRLHLRAAIDHINQHYGDAERCVISGDMVNRGTAADYAALRLELDRLSQPVVAMVGNHDDRDLLAAGLGAQLDAGGFAQSAFTTGDARVLCLDTLTPGADHGSYCADRLEWLSAQLAQYLETPTYVFMHHPPLCLGLPMQDKDRLIEAAPMLDALSAAPQVKHLFLGHVHRPITGTVRGIPFSTMRSVLMQAPPPRPNWDWDSFKPAPDAPAIGVVAINGADVVMQYVEFGL